MIKEISKSAADVDMYKTVLSRVERLEQLADPPMPDDVKRPAVMKAIKQQDACKAETGKSAAAEAVKRDSKSRVEVLE